MACCYKYHYLFLHSHSLWRKLPLLPNSTTRTFSRNLRTPTLFHSSGALHSKGYCSASTDSLGAVPATSSPLVPDTAFGTGEVLRLGSAAKGERVINADPLNSTLNSRVMIIDGTSIIHRAYYKLLAKLYHGHLTHADGNGDWVLTIFTALSLIIDVLEFIPSHVVVVFDHDGLPFGHTYNSSKESFTAKDNTCHHKVGGYPNNDFNCSGV